MKKEEKTSYLLRRISELENVNNSLVCENNSLSKQLEVNKTAILLRKETLDKKERQIDNILKAYEKTVAELNEIKSNYEKAVKIAKETKNTYDASAKKLLTRLKKQQ